MYGILYLLFVFFINRLLAFRLAGVSRKWFVVLCVVVTVVQNGLRTIHNFEFHTNSDQHTSEVCPKPMKIKSLGVLGPFRVAGCVNDDFGARPVVRVTRPKTS